MRYFLNRNNKISAYIFQTPTSSLSHEKRPRSCFSRNFLNSVNAVQVTLFLKLHKDGSFLDELSSVKQFKSYKNSLYKKIQVFNSVNKKKYKKVTVQEEKGAKVTKTKVNVIKTQITFI